MKTLEYRSYKGLNIICTRCGKVIHLNVKPYKNCTHDDISKHAYKAVLFDPHTHERKCRRLKARTYDSAIKELIDFKEELANPYYAVVEAVKEKPHELCLAMADYISYLNNYNVPYHEQKARDRDYIKNIEVHLNEFMTFLALQNIDIHKFKLESISNLLVGEYVRFLEGKLNKNTSFNNSIKTMRVFNNWMIKNKYKIENVFAKVRYKPVKNNPLSMTQAEYESVIRVISPNDAFSIDKSGTRRLMYRSWLVDAIQAALFTGRRNIELFLIKWSDILEENGEPLVIKGVDVKVSKQKSTYKYEDVKAIFIPLIQELRELIYRLGYEDNKGSDCYIIAPNEYAKRENLADDVSSIFTFFWKKTGIKRDISFKNLRKTYTTQFDIFLKHGVGTEDASNHDSKKILDEHYIDKYTVAKAIVKSNFRVFPKRSENDESKP